MMVRLFFIFIFFNVKYFKTYFYICYNCIWWILMINEVWLCFTVQWDELVSSGKGMNSQPLKMIFFKCFSEWMEIRPVFCFTEGGLKETTCVLSPPLTLYCLIYTANENSLDGFILFLFVCTGALTSFYLTLSQTLSVLQSLGVLSKAERERERKWDWRCCPFQ